MSRSRNSSGSNFRWWEHWAVFKKVSLERGFYEITDVLQPGGCPHWTIFRLKVVDKREVAYGSYEFIFKKGNTTVRGISFEQNGGPANNEKMKKGFTYYVTTASSSVIGVTYRNMEYNYPNISSNLEFHFPELKIIKCEPNRSGTNFDTELNGISQINQAIEAGGIAWSYVELRNVTIDGCKFHRYKGCPNCRTKMVYHPNDNRLICSKCGPTGEITVTEDRQWEYFMLFRQIRFKDENGNSFEGGVIFHDQCKKIFGEICHQFLFDEQLNQVAEETLNGAKVNAFMKLHCTGDRWGLSCVVYRIEILSQHSSNGISLNCEPLPAIPHDGILNGSEIGNLSKQEPMDEGQCTAQFDGILSSDKRPPLMRVAFKDSTSVSQGNESDDSDSDESSDSDSTDPPPQPTEAQVWPLLRELETAAGLDREYQLKKVGVLILNNYSFSNVGTDFEDRLGSEQDVKKLVRLFSETIEAEIFRIPFQDVKSSDLPNLIIEFKHFLRKIGADSLMIFILSHGEQNLLLMSDGIFINIYTDILHFFSDDEFPEFAGKAKMYFPLGCQEFSQLQQKPSRCNGFKSSQTSASKVNNEAPFKHLNPNGFLTAEYSSFLICIPQLPGNSAVRLPDYGTPFVHYFCEAVREHCSSLHVLELIERVKLAVFKLCEFHMKKGKIANQVPQALTIDFHGKYFFQPRQNSNVAD